MRTFIAVCCLASVAAPGPLRAEGFDFQDGDRIVFIGSTLIEREQKYGYWEAALTIAYPDRGLTFRNLGWSGDTVWGESRASFDPPAIGYKRLIDHTLALRPTVIFVGYGTNEAFAGQTGLPQFQKQFDKLLDDLAPAKARLVLMAPLIDPAALPTGKAEDRKRDLKAYTAAIKQTAERRKAQFVDELCERYASADRLTDAGMQLTGYGYWSTASNLLTELRLGKRRHIDAIDLDGSNPKRVQQKFLSNPPVPSDRGVTAFQADSLIRVKKLPPGKYLLQIDGKPVTIKPNFLAKTVVSADAETWIKTQEFGGMVMQGPSLDQAEQLRKLIVEKNQLYFHRWRPQNETYLFGFRKREQGQNAKEIPEFDPLIEKLEKEIARLKVPAEHMYQLVPVEEKK